MTSYRYNFERVTIRGVRSGTCLVCGKRGTRQTTFGQTLNPFNKNADGEPKTRAEIWAEIKQEAHEYSQGAFFHAGCES